MSGPPGRRWWSHAFASGMASEAPAPKRGWQARLLARVEQHYAEFCLARVWEEFRASADLGQGVRLSLGARIVNRHRKEAIRIGDNVVIRGTIRVERKGELVIGDEVYIGDDVIISAAERVAIGRNTLIAHGVQIFDNASHPLGHQERAHHFRILLGLAKKQIVDIPAAGITIGEGCWLGLHSMILKGVTIGDRSIVAAGAVITKDVPADTLAVSEGRLTFRPLTGDAEPAAEPVSPLAGK